MGGVLNQLTAIFEGIGTIPLLLIASSSGVGAVWSLLERKKHEATGGGPNIAIVIILGIVCLVGAAVLLGRYPNLS